MKDSVLDKVLEQSRQALLGGIPILYIKTDSDIFIRNLLCVKENPLVVLLSDGGSLSDESKFMRPIYTMEEGPDQWLERCENYRNGLPKAGESGLYSILYKDAAAGEIKGPFLWMYKMPEDPQEQAVCMKRLSAYVASHSDPNHPQYRILQSCVVLLYSAQVHLANSLYPYTEFVDIPYPDEEEIREIIKTESQGDPTLIGNEQYLSSLCTDFLGFTTEEIVITMQRIMTTVPLEDSVQVETLISDRKRQKMQGGLLEHCVVNGRIGGMKRYCSWLRGQVDPLKNSNSYMRKIGTPPPKGVLMCGIPGCGKSEAAKFTAKTLELPLLKMDIGSLVNKYQGVSEQQMRDALRMAEAMAPCVLWIDELEKGFSGAGPDGDSSSSRRMFGYMLTWMQDNRKPCFLFATANDISGLPKEFFRSGRFEALYAVYLPTQKECIGIFQASMKRAQDDIAEARHLGRDEVVLFPSDCYDDRIYEQILSDMLVLPDGSPRIVIGADIQKIVSTALRRLYSARGINRSNWEAALREVISDPGFNVYGDSTENLESIAVGYCRMLRKGFLPTADDVLFRKEDYHTEVLENDGEDILQGSVPSFAGKYDKAIYMCLKARINVIARKLERRERDLVIMR